MLTLRATIERLEALSARRGPTLPIRSLRAQIVDLDLLRTQVDPPTRARIEELVEWIARGRYVPGAPVVASGAPRVKQWLCVASGVIGNVATGAPRFKRWTCAASGSIGIHAAGAPTVKRWLCVASGNISIRATGAPQTKRWTCAASGNISINATGAPSTKKWTCVASGTVSAPVFDPATLNLTGWWRTYPGKVAMDGGTPWTGTPSAGSSGSHNLTKVVGSNRSPHDGPNLNGFLTADFQQVADDELAQPTSNATMFSASAGSAWFLVFPNTIASHSSTLYQNGNLLTDGGNAETDFCFTASGAGLVLFSGGVYKEVVTPCGGSAWHLLQFKWDGTNQKVRVDSGPWVSSLCGPWSQTSPGAMQVGQSFADTRRWDGRMEDIGTSATVISDADFDNIKSYINARYGLSL